MVKSIFLFLIVAFWGSVPAMAQPLHAIVKSRKIALTFDACMTSGMLKRVENGTDKPLKNSEVITLLHVEKIPATIFLTGLWAEKYPNLVHEIASDTLFEIGNHSFSHRGFIQNCYTLPTLPEKEKEADILKSQEILAGLTGKRPALFRFPGGCYTSADVSLVKKLGLKVIGWTFPSGDAFNGNTESIVQNVLARAKPGAIIVFHITAGHYAPATAKALHEIIPALRKQGYEFSRVSDL